MWPLAPTQGPKPGSVGATLHPVVVGRFSQNTAQAAARPLLFLSSRFKWERGGEERRGGVDTKASEKMCKLPVGSRAETGRMS